VGAERYMRTQMAPSAAPTNHPATRPTSAHNQPPSTKPRITPMTATTTMAIWICLVLSTCHLVSRLRGIPTGAPGRPLVRSMA